MAEQNNQPLKGLVQDYSPEAQPENTYSYALNSINETKDGDKGFLASELGNAECLDFSTIEVDSQTFDFKIIGKINLLDDEVALFLATEDKSMSAIVIQKNCTFRLVLANDCLNFSIYHQVRGIFKIRKGCNRVIYFVDGFNPDRVIDLDEILNNPTENRYINSFGNFDCSLIKQSPDFQMPRIDYIRTNNFGGQLQLGVYQFTIALGDEDLNFTEWLSITNPIPIVDGQLTDSNFNQIQGGNPLQAPITTKSIDLQFVDLDTNFDYVKVGVIQTIGGVTSAYTIVTLSITKDGNPVSILNYTYNGIDTNSATQIPLPEIAAPRVIFDTSHTIEQQDGRLLKANIKEKLIDYSVLQRAANLINVNYVTRPIRYKDFESSVISGNYYQDYRTYMRDEIYALGITPIFTDGSEGPVFHIPGRQADTYITTPGVDPNLTTGQRLTNRVLPNSTAWDTSEYTVSNSLGNNYNTVFIEDVKHLNKAVGDKVKRWEVYNTAIRTYTATDFWQGDYTRGILSYWESDYSYPNIEDCNRNRLYPTGKIRHHKMPDTTLEPHHLNTNTNDGWVEDDYIFPLGLDFDLTNFHTFVTSNLPTAQQSLIRGYKIVRAKRDDFNKTVIDKGLSYRNMLLYFNPDLTHTPEFSQLHNHQTPFLNRWSYIYGGFENIEGLWTIYRDKLIDDFDTGAPINIQPIIDSTPGSFIPLGYSKKILPNPDQNGLLNINSSEDPKYWYNHKSLSYHGAEAKFGISALGADYIKYEKELWSKIGYYGYLDEASHDEAKWALGVFANYNCPPVAPIQYHLVNGNPYINNNVKYLGTPPPNCTNRAIQTQSNIDSNRIQAASANLVPRFINGTQQKTYNLNLIDNIDFRNTASGTTVISDNLSTYGSPPDLFKFENEAPGAYTPLWDFNSFTFDGIEYESTSTAYYIALKKNNSKIYGQINNIIYYDISPVIISPTLNSVRLFGGDCFISLMSVRKTFLQDDYRNDDETYFTSLSHFFGESEINTALRHLGYGTTTENIPAQYYPLYNTNQEISQLLIGNELTIHGIDADRPTYEWMDDLVLEIREGNYLKNTYNYNRDYSKEQKEKPKLPLPLGFDYCSRCRNKFEHRIVFSQKSYQEEISDNYLKFLANNYRDIPANSGQIINLFKQKDELFARTNQSVWFIPTRPQQLQTNEGSIQVGTGEFFSIPPKELYTLNTGYAGGQSYFDLIVTEFGTYFIDDLKGKVFQFQDSILEVTQGNESWFRENIPFNILKSYPRFPLLDNTASNIGIGFITTYDPRYKRLIIAKKDYQFIEREGVFYDVQEYEPDRFRWLIVDQNIADPKLRIFTIDNPFERPDYFENKSWTISYDLEEKQWISYHSYLPSFMYNTQSKWYSNLYNSKLWEHNKGNFQTYYGTKYKHIFEYVVNVSPLTTKILNDIQYISEVEVYNPRFKQYVQYKDRTYNECLIYNHTQSTGIIDIKVKDNTDPFTSVLTSFDPSEILASNKESVWSINSFRDMVVQTNPIEPIFTSDWNTLMYQLAYPIDKVPNMNVLNYTKSQFEMEVFRDNAIKVRLFYKDSTDNSRILTKYITSDISESNR